MGRGRGRPGRHALTGGPGRRPRAARPGGPGSSQDFSLRPLALSAYGPSLLFGLGEAAVVPVVVSSARERGATPAVAAAVLLALSAGSLLFNVPASVITARAGERRALAGAGAAGALAALWCTVAGGLLAFTAGVVLLGMSTAVFLVARQSYLTEAVPATHRARALSTLGGVMRVGAFAGPLLGAAVIGGWGVRAAYLVCAVAVALAGMLAATLPDLPAPAAGPGEQALPAATVGSVLRAHRRVFATVGVGVLLVGAVRASRQVAIPLWATHLGLSPQVTSLVFGVAGAAEMLVFYPAGLVMDRRGRRWVTVPSMLVLGLGLLLLPLAAGVAAFAALAVLIGLGNGIGSGMVMTLGADHAPRHGRAQFLGLWRLAGDLGQTAGPGLVALLTALSSVAVAIAATGVVGLVAAAVMWRVCAPVGVPART